MAATDIAIIGSFSIDSVLLPDGSACAAKPGGNALWSALGAFLAGRRPRILARVGEDYPAHVLDRLAAAGFDLSALVRLSGAHPVRVCYAHLPDGRRLQPVPAEKIAHLPAAERACFIDTTSRPEMLSRGAPAPEDIPEPWKTEVAHWHLPLLPLARHRALVAALAPLPGRVQADCPSRGDLRIDPFGKLAETLGALEIFLPSTSDLDVFAPQLSPVAALDILRASGAARVLLKAGADGCLLDDGSRRLSMAAFPGTPVDPTGTGDAFCGGLLAARASGADMVQAAAIASACASFALATDNPLDLLDIAPWEVELRTQALLQTVAPLVPHETTENASWPA